MPLRGYFRSPRTQRQRSLSRLNTCTASFLSLYVAYRSEPQDAPAQPRELCCLNDLVNGLVGRPGLFREAAPCDAPYVYAALLHVVLQARAPVHALCLVPAHRPAAPVRGRVEGLCP